MQIDFKTHNRQSLGFNQRNFLVKAINFSWYLQYQIESKYKFFYGGSPKVSSTLLLAEIVYKSEWGLHPVSRDDEKWGNNLALLEVDKYWTHKTICEKYKAFSDWESFGTHWSDIIVMHKKLEGYTLDLLENSCYDSNRKELILLYNLKEFELNER